MQGQSTANREISFESPNARQTRHPERSSGWLSWCVLCRSEGCAPLHEPETPRLLYRVLVRMPLAFGCALEMHSLLHRIAIRCRRRSETFFLLFSSVRQRKDQPHPEANIRRRACIRDIESYVAQHPWATILDLEIYRDAWQAGAAWAESNACKSEHSASEA